MSPFNLISATSRHRLAVSSIPARVFRSTGQSDASPSGRNRSEAFFSESRRDWSADRVKDGSASCKSCNVWENQFDCDASRPVRLTARRTVSSGLFMPSMTTAISPSPSLPAQDSFLSASKHLRART